MFVCVCVRISREFCGGGKDVGVRATEHAEFEKWILKKPFFKLISGQDIDFPGPTFLALFWKVCEKIGFLL